ncbi:hypothetical protein ACOME3_003014 [Neoechinorhynchus agilis]
MSGRWIPIDYWSPKLSMWKNSFENPSAAQFNHRTLATFSLAVLSATGILARRIPMLTLPGNLMLIATTAQFSLGVFTLLYQVPISLASAHQMGSIALFSSVLYLLATLLRLPKP